MSVMLCPNCDELVDTDYHPEDCPNCNKELFESYKKDLQFELWYEKMVKETKDEN